MGMFKVNDYFPPTNHEERIKRYKDNKKLFYGKHFDVLERENNRLTDHQQELIYISTNLPSLICKKSADFLFGEAAKYNAGREDNSKEQVAFERFEAENNLNVLNYESALGGAFRGDVFYKIRWGQRWQGEIDSKLDPFRLYIESQNPEYVFPETLPGDAKNIFAYHIAYPVHVKGSKGQEYILKIESHYPGRIVYQEKRMKPVSYLKGEPVRFKIYADIKDKYKVDDSNIPFPLVIHAPNYALDDSWEGIDDLTEHYSIFAEINNRLSRIAEILDKHSDPAMAVPQGSLDLDPDGNPVFHAGRDKIFEYGDGVEEPKYITWNGQLDAGFKELERLVDFLLMTAEIPPVVLGKDNSGTSGSSGSGIKQRMNSLLLKIKRKRQYFETALQKVLHIAQLVEHEKARDVDYEVVKFPRILFNERLVEDEMEKATIAQARTGGKTTISVKSTLENDYGLTEEQAERELERIREEEKQEGIVDPSIFNREVDVDLNA